MRLIGMHAVFAALVFLAPLAVRGQDAPGPATETILDVVFGRDPGPFVPAGVTPGDLRFDAEAGLALIRSEEHTSELQSPNTT